MPTVLGEKLCARARQSNSPPADKWAWTRILSSSSDRQWTLLTASSWSLAHRLGKTTTLYSALNELNNPTYNIVTVEDPVEFQIPGINQVPVKRKSASLSPTPCARFCVRTPTSS